MILRYQKQNCNLQRVWRGFVKIDDVLATPQMKGLEAQSKTVKDAIEEEPCTFEQEIWKNEEYIRLVWKGSPVDTLK